MDSSAKDMFRLEKRSEDRLNNNDPEFSSHWNHSTNLGFYQNTMSTSINLPVPLPSMDWNPLQSMPKGGVFFPAFIDPAFSGIVNPFGGTLEPSNSYGNASKSTAGAQFRNHGLNTQQAFKDASVPIDHGFRKGESTVVEGGERGEAPDSADGSGSVDSSNRKKIIQQDMELDQVQENLRSTTTEAVTENDLNKQKLEPSNSTRTNMKSDGKKSKDGSNSPKEDYIHMRARRGQATNSHSLAERVRREKISERMKYLQELVPGCNKVTGKAVMLDEIINYVQSLQRQVEFLSMKLAAVNPRLDFNIKDSRGGPPTIGFSPDVPSQRGLVQAGISGLMNPPDAIRGAIHGQMNIMNGYKDTRPQASNPWENQIHNFVQPSLDVNPFMNTHEFVKSGHVFPL